MAVLFIGDSDTRGCSAPPETIEAFAGNRERQIEKVKATELETLWRLTDTRGQWNPIRIVTNRYEESHRIMQEAHARQEQQQ